MKHFCSDYNLKTQSFLTVLQYLHLHHKKNLLGAMLKFSDGMIIRLAKVKTRLAVPIFDLHCIPVLYLGHDFLCRISNMQCK